MLSYLQRIFFSIKHHKRAIATLLLATLVLLLLGTKIMSDTLHDAYQEEVSARVLDRNGELLALAPNAKEAYMTEATGTPRLRELIIRSEDRYFFYHPGINPWSTLRSFVHYVFFHRHVGGSTITQQLVKNLLHNENDRTLINKLREALYAVALELHSSKEEILTMYISSAYFGSRMEGIEEASRYYFAKSASSLSDGEIVRLLALLASPAALPGSAANEARAEVIARRIGVTPLGEYKTPPRALRENKSDPAMFELGGMLSCDASCTTSVDRDLSAKIREIVRTNLASPKFRSVENAAVAVIAIGKGEEPNRLLALIGSPDPYGISGGKQINMALAARPIGSTWKPFIYGKAIEGGARPYTLIDDSEYRFEIGTGFAFYPKNYDGIYRGPVTLNYALSNSLNVPAVRALQFDGIEPFGVFMQESLSFVPKQSFDTYQLSVALGGLEMNPLLLADYFTVFPRGGVLFPLTLTEGVPLEIPMMHKEGYAHRIFAATTTALINKMLSDRLMGVEQFGLESNLNLPFSDYAVKTGTTYDYHDSWTVGYTRDVAVVAWIGNSDNKAMDLLTGARGAGKIWHDVMALLYAEGDIAPKPFDTSALSDVETSEGNSFGLAGDDVSRARTIMLESNVVLEPHDGDVLQYAPRMSVPLRSREVLSWKVDGTIEGSGTALFWTPPHAGNYVLSATQRSGEVLTLRIRITD